MNKRNRSFAALCPPLVSLLNCKKDIVICIVLSLMVQLVSANCVGQSVTDSLAAPFTLKGIDGKEHSMQDMLGNKLTVIVFWATWGTDSIKMLDDLQQLYGKYKNNGLEIIGVCVEQQVITDSIRQKIVDTLQRKQVTFPNLIDHELQTFRLYGVIAVPTTFVVDRSLRILYKLSGYPIVGRDQLYDFVLEKIGVKTPKVVHVQKGHEPNKEALRIYNMARLEFKKGRVEAASRYVARANSIDSLFANPLLLLAEIHLSEDNLTEAAKALERALKLEPKSADALSLKGLLLTKQGNTAEAIELLQKAVSQDSTKAMAHCYLGYALGCQGDLQGALREFSHAELLSNDDYRIPLFRYKVYMRFQKMREAATDSVKAQRLREASTIHY
ncbi:MAG: redoxin domain-containing protein [Bacteroidetes bacterium]|nr:redoxin domain-containing protein [Bacteroidota bacterium]MCL5737277.1 redoxin domain-containing protein [Bacteroidota bacterium]